MTETSIKLYERQTLSNTTFCSRHDDAHRVRRRSVCPCHRCVRCVPALRLLQFPYLVGVELHRGSRAIWCAPLHHRHAHDHRAGPHLLHTLLAARGLVRGRVFQGYQGGLGAEYRHRPPGRYSLHHLWSVGILHPAPHHYGAQYLTARLGHTYRLARTGHYDYPLCGLAQCRVYQDGAQRPERGCL